MNEREVVPQNAQTYVVCVQEIEVFAL